MEAERPWQGNGNTLVWKGNICHCLEVLRGLCVWVQWKGPVRYPGLQCRCETEPQGKGLVDSGRRSSETMDLVSKAMKWSRKGGETWGENTGGDLREVPEGMFGVGRQCTREWTHQSRRLERGGSREGSGGTRHWTWACERQAAVRTNRKARKRSWQATDAAYLTQKTREHDKIGIDL